MHRHPCSPSFADVVRRRVGPWVEAEACSIGQKTMVPNYLANLFPDFPYRAKPVISSVAGSDHAESSTDMHLHLYALWLIPLSSHLMVDLCFVRWAKLGATLKLPMNFLPSFSATSIESHQDPHG
jgi:hypothetical protein